MKKQNDLIINASAVELSHLDPSKPISIHIGENTLVAVPERMTAMEAVNTITALTGVTSALLDAVKEACGSCADQMGDGDCPYEDACGQEECPFETVRGPGVTLTDEARKAMGIPLDAKLELFPDEGEELVCAADYEHDITDVPEGIRTMLVLSGVCQ